MLQVFRDEREKEQSKSRIVRTVHGECSSSGLCPPTRDIVKRRYERTHQPQSFLPFKVRQVVDEILSGAHIPTEQQIQQLQQKLQQQKQQQLPPQATTTSQPNQQVSI